MSPSNSPQPFKTIGVVGSGTMGSGIAQVAAQKGFEVILYDVKNEFLDRAFTRIRTFLADGEKRGKVTPEEAQAVEENLNSTTEIKAVAQVDLLIEAIPEDMALKRQLFQALDESAFEHTVFASNTSSLSITGLAGAVQRPAQFAGLHFFNPVPLMKLVEVIEGQRTSAETVQRLMAFSEALGKVPVRAKDTPGFIVNRVARPFYGEAFRLLGERVASVETLDTILKQAGGFRMGPFELIDLIGMDVNFAVTQSVYQATFQEPRYRPHPIQQRMVEAGLLGRKSGEGFYKYE
jgi:3-hydroxybutyryl-CoA dehydrogenase